MRVYTTPRLPGLSKTMSSAAPSLAGWSALFGRRKGGRGQRGYCRPVNVGLLELGFPGAEPERDLGTTQNGPPYVIHAQRDGFRRWGERRRQLLRNLHIPRGAGDAHKARFTDLQPGLVRRAARQTEPDK